MANTAALAAAGIGKGYEFGPGGLVELDADGMPNGILREQATKIFDELIPDPAKIPEVKEKIMREALPPVRVSPPSTPTPRTSGSTLRIPRTTCFWTARGSCPCVW